MQTQIRAKIPNVSLLIRLVLCGRNLAQYVSCWPQPWWQKGEQNPSDFWNSPVTQNRLYFLIFFFSRNFTLLRFLFWNTGITTNLLRIPFSLINQCGKVFELKDSTDCKCQVLLVLWTNEQRWTIISTLQRRNVIKKRGPISSCQIQRSESFIFSRKNISVLFFKWFCLWSLLLS